MAACWAREIGRKRTMSEIPRTEQLGVDSSPVDFGTTEARADDAAAREPEDPTRLSWNDRPLGEVPEM